MKTIEVAAVFAIAVLLILIFYFISAKGEKRRLIIINSEGKEVGIDAEIADSSATMAKGLMGRASLGENEGMLFVFQRSGKYPFWMLNTTIPLDAIFFDERGNAVDVIQMQPCGLNVVKCRTYTPKAPSRYVLEVKQSFSDMNKIVPGNSTLVLDSVRG